jgi:large subunit ribosomal protein L11e
MREVRVAKLTLNICTGESGDRLQKAAKVCFSVGGGTLLNRAKRGLLQSAKLRSVFIVTIR